jgi:galactonate dehydratase
MKVTSIETLTVGEFPNILFVLVHTDEGISGLGETFFGAQAVASYVHETVAPHLLGKDPLLIQQHASALSGYLGYAGTGVETRGNSAVDIALWDLFGQSAGQPVHQLLGGRSRDRIRVYNTCAGYRYVRRRPRQSVDNWGLPEGEPEGPYEDLEAFLHRADELAESLLAEGITGMKIWPFDRYAEEGGGNYLSNGSLRQALEPFEKIRSAVGDRMDVMVEFHGLWNLPAAKGIIRALEDYHPYWLEDPVRADDLDALAELAATTDVPLALSETLGGRAQYRDLLTSRAAKVVILDIGWVGGLTEARAIGAMAQAHHLPVAPHDCTGPVVLMACAHLSMHLPNALVQEFVRASYSTWYGELVTDLPVIAEGYMAAPEAPGLGTQLHPDVLRRGDLERRVSRLPT